MRAIYTRRMTYSAALPHSKVSRVSRNDQRAIIRWSDCAGAHTGAKDSLCHMNVEPERPFNTYPVLGKLDEVAQAIVGEIRLRCHWALLAGEDGRWQDISSGH